MIDWSNVNYNNDVKYMNMVVAAGTAVEQITGKVEEVRFGRVGEDYFTSLAMAAVFTDINIDDIAEDIDGFMENVISGRFMKTIESRCDTNKVTMMRRMINEGIEAEKGKDVVFELIEKLTKTVEKINDIMDAVKNGDENVIEAVMKLTNK